MKKSNYVSPAYNIMRVNIDDIVSQIQTHKQRKISMHYNVLFLIQVIQML